MKHPLSTIGVLAINVDSQCLQKNLCFLTINIKGFVLTLLKMYRPPKVRPKNLTIGRSVFSWQNILLKLRKK
mgnify:CR=1 FL=1